MALSKKDHIAKSALQSFAQYGYSDTTMDTIADMAQVAKGTLYYHFKTKEELFLYVNQKGVSMLIDSIHNSMKDETKTLPERLSIMLDEHLRFFSEHHEFCLLLLSFSTGDVKRDGMIRCLLGRYFETVEQFLVVLQQQGVIDSSLEISTLASALFGMIAFTVLRKLYREEPIYTEDTRETLKALCKGVLNASYQKKR